MNDFKDKQVIYARLYLFIVPLALLCTYSIALLMVTFKPESYSVVVPNLEGIMQNIAGSLAGGYGVASIMTILYAFVGIFRKQNSKVIKAILVILLLPAILLFTVPSMIATIPYYVSTIIKTKRITIDDKSLFSRNRIITLVIFLIIAIVVTAVAVFVTK